MELLFSDWLGALGVIALTLLANGLVRALLPRLARNRFAFLKELTPALSNLIYIVGLKLFSDVAPLSPKAIVWVEGAVYVLGVILVMTLVRRAALLSLEWGALRANQSPALQLGFIPLMKNVITLFVFFSGGIMILKHFDYDVLSLLTALGVGSLAVGLAAKETLANMISGFTLIIDRNLKPGDRVNLAGTVGNVEEIGLRSTRIRIGDGNTLIVPNAELVNTKLINISLPNMETTCSTTLRVPFAVPFPKMKAICLELLEQVDKAVPDRGKWVNLTSVNEGHQLISVGFWLAHPDHAGGALSDFHERLLARVAAEEIELLGPPSGRPALFS